MKKTVNEPGREDWTFGQVIAILVLIAPLVTMVETYCDSMSLRFIPHLGWPLIIDGCRVFEGFARSDSGWRDRALESTLAFVAVRPSPPSPRTSLLPRELQLSNSSMVWPYRSCMGYFMGAVSASPLGCRIPNLRAFHDSRRFLAFTANYAGDVLRLHHVFSGLGTFDSSDFAEQTLCWPHLLLGLLILHR